MDKKQIVEQLYKNQEVKEFVKANNLTDDKVLQGYAKFSAYIEASEICKNCDGKVCLANVESMKPTLAYDDYGHVSIVYEDCNIVKKYDPDNLEVIDYSDINVEINYNKPRLELLKELNVFSEKYFNGESPKGIYLYGPVGVGKSLLLYSFAKSMVGKGAKVLFAYYPDLVRRSQNSFGTPKVEELIMKLKKADILMLDDIGREANTAYVRDEILGPILQYRCDNMLPVFMTSNRSFSDLETHLSDTSASDDKVKAAALIARIKFLMKEYQLSDKDYREENL